MAAQFTRLFMDGADRTVLEVSSVGYRTIPLEVGTDWNTIHIAWRWSWSDNGFLPGEGPHPGLPRPNLFMGLCSAGKPPSTANAHALGVSIAQNFVFAWNAYPADPEIEPLGKTSFYHSFQGTLYTSGIPIRAEVGNVNFFPRYGETTNSDAFMIRIEKNNPSALLDRWVIRRLYTAEYAFMDDGSPSGAIITPETFRSSLHADNFLVTRNIWNDSAGTALRPLPKLFSLGSSGTFLGFGPPAEDIEGPLDHLCIYWDMVGSVHSVYIYDVHVIRVD